MCCFSTTEGVATMRTDLVLENVSRNVSIKNKRLKFIFLLV